MPIYSRLGLPRVSKPSQHFAPHSQPNGQRLWYTMTILWLIGDFAGNPWVSTVCVHSHPNSWDTKGGFPAKFGVPELQHLGPQRYSRASCPGLPCLGQSSWRYQNFQMAPEKCVPLSHSPHFGGLIYLRTSDLKIQVAGADSVTASGWQQDSCLNLWRGVCTEFPRCETSKGSAFETQTISG